MPRRRARPAIVVAISILVLVTSGVPTAGAADDITPPVGTMELWNMDNETQLAELHLSFSDPESGIDHVLVICDSGPDFNIPYTTKLFWPMHDGTGGCSTAYGEHWILVQVYNGAGLFHDAVFANVSNGPTMHVTVSAAPTTGHAVTIAPVLPDDFTIPNGSFCRWEFRWGTTEALDVTFTGDTFGGLLFDVPASAGGCGPWTFTLPWVPFRQYDVIVEVGKTEPDGGQAFGLRAHARFSATSDGTDRRILSSNLPIAQVLPSTYQPIVGVPITYTRYLVGGASGCCNARWDARLGSGENPTQWTQSGGSTFTFTPNGTGDLFVGWDRTAANGLLLSGYFDPPVRYPDRTAPTVTAPQSRIRGATVGRTVPITIDWTGSDKGWGIASYQLQSSVNGGAWSLVALPAATARAVAIAATPGSSVRFRVRAKDKAGNWSSWATGSTVTAVTVSNSSPEIAFTPGKWRPVLDRSALLGSLDETSVSASASYAVNARAIGWVAERGPRHGKAYVYVDNVLRATVDLATATDARHVVFSYAWSSVGAHTIRITNAVTSGRPLIDVDALVVLR